MQWDETVAVTVTTLDDLIDRYGEPAFCKIDVEGYELDVLRGLSRPIRALSFEYVVAAKEAALDCIRYLRQLGVYEYNWSPGESQEMQEASWLGAEQMSAHLQGLPGDEGSGDVYARLVHTDLDQRREA